MAGAVRPPTMKIDSTPPAASPLLPNLRLANLSSNREQTYYILVVLLSVIAWVVLAFTIIGAAYALLAGFFLWLGHGLLAAHLRAEAVHVNERQMPELHATFLAVCQQLEITDPPRLCVLQSGGVLNAFAMRHAGRDFVVVYSEFLEAFGPDSPEIRFILGHELGHLKSRHVLKQILLAPGLIFPLIGPAYRRAWETSCDRHGAFVAGDMNGALRAMLTLSGGKSPGRALNAEAFASQYEEERGFFVSLHELTSSYPTLSRRVRDLRALQDGTEASRAPRHPLAYFAALFVPGGNVGGGGASSANCSLAARMVSRVSARKAASVVASSSARAVSSLSRSAISALRRSPISVKVATAPSSVPSGMRIGAVLHDIQRSPASL